MQDQREGEGLLLMVKMRPQSVQILCCEFVAGDSTSGGQLCGSLEATGRLFFLEDVQKAS